MSAAYLLIPILIPTAAGIIGLCVLYRGLEAPARRRLLIGLCLLILAMDLAWDLILLRAGQCAFNYLPLDLCGIAMFGELLWAARGGALAMKRILRCNPFVKGGYDPVPEAPSAIIRRDENS